ncbi:MAG: hypothetical protein KatS3mg034_0446 [Vicingaceae bacterium]|nr:MAG: hypothetical protein KatS3mg034_0446 [Vicingaceae bacterium]
MDSLFFEEENLNVNDGPGLKPCRPTFVLRMVVGMEAFFQIGSVTDVELLMFMREQDIDVEELHRGKEKAAMSGLLVAGAGLEPASALGGYEPFKIET